MKEKVSNFPYMKRSIVFFFVVLSLLLIITVLITEYPQNWYKKHQLKVFYSKLMNAEKMNDLETIYDYLSPQSKRDYSLQDFIDERGKRPPPYSQEFTALSYDVRGDLGYVDRKVVICITPDCSGDNRYEDRASKEYVYLSGEWYVEPKAKNASLCNRDDPYPMPREFSRAISLIIQRFGDSRNADVSEFSKQLDQIKNCLNITYALSENEIGGNEGVFSFSEASSPENLEIQVSPKYSATDDILTAILLTHEISHAMFYANGSIDILDCYENEAQAFTNEWFFYVLLNKEEQKSITSRILETQNATNTVMQFLTINRLPGSTYYDKALSFVKSSEVYQQQCNNMNQ